MSFLRNWCCKRPVPEVKEKFLSVQLGGDTKELDFLIKTLRDKIWYRNAKSKYVGPIMMVAGVGTGYGCFFSAEAAHGHEYNPLKYASYAGGATLVAGAMLTFCTKPKGPEADLISTLNESEQALILKSADKYLMPLTGISTLGQAIAAFEKEKNDRELISIAVDEYESGRVSP